MIVLNKRNHSNFNLHCTQLFYYSTNAISLDIVIKAIHETTKDFKLTNMLFNDATIMGVTL